MDLIVSNDQAKAAILDWLIPLTENGGIDDLWKAFVDELTPYAAQVARRTLRKQMPFERDNDVLAKLHDFLGQLRGALELVTLNPDMMAPASEQMERELMEAQLELSNWIDYLNRRRPSSPEAEVRPTTTVMMAGGGVP